MTPISLDYKNIQFAIAEANGPLNTTPQERTRCFVSVLAWIIHCTNKPLAAEIFALLDERSPAIQSTTVPA